VLPLEGPGDRFVFVLRGAGRVGGAAVAAGQAGALGAGALAVDGAFDALVGVSAPMPRAPVFDGPFCLFDRAGTAAAAARFRAGAMGRLAPSPAFARR
jgi:hypothetical protein